MRSGLSCALVLVLAVPKPMPAQLRADDQFRFRTSGIEVTVRFHDDRAKPLGSQLREVVSGGLAQYSRLFGAAPLAADGSPLVRLTVNVGSDRVGGGGTEPGVVSLLVGREAAPEHDGWKVILLHELFHLWSGASLRYAGPAEQWFNEGAADFYALQTAARLSVLDRRAVVRAAETAVGSYAGSESRSRPSLMQAANATVHARRRDPAGWTAALVLDRDIRERTRNARSMDDVMRWLFANRDENARPFANLDIARALREATGADFTEFFARHVFGQLPLPVGDTLRLGELAGLLEGAAGAVNSDVDAAPHSLLLYSLGLRPIP